MLNENIKLGRTSKGLSQDDLALRLNVVRQTVSKWERGLSVPDANMLIALSKVLEIPVSKLLGSNMEKEKVDQVDVLAKKLELINAQLAENKERKRKFTRGILVGICLALCLIFVILVILRSPYLNWNYQDPEWAVSGVLLHGFEWVFMRVFPFVLIGLIVGLIMTRKK